MLAILGPLLSLLGLEAATFTTTLKRHTIVWGLIGVLGVMTVAFLLVAADTALSYAVGPVVAPLIIAAAATIVAVGIFLVAHLHDAAEARRNAEREKSAEVTALVTTALLTAVPLILRSPLMRRIGLPVGAILASALMLRKSGAPHRD